MSRKSQYNQQRRSDDAFSLIEIMVTVALLTVIILGLLLMFNQVQRAFRSSMTQVDVLEAGRAVTDLVVRDLEQMVPTQMPYDNRYWSTNFFAIANPSCPPLLQFLPGSSGPNGPFRTNIIQTVFFTSKINQSYIGNGYFVYPDSVEGSVGTLYRYTTNRPKNTAVQLSTDFAQQFRTVVQNGPTNMPSSVSRIADGVVAFHVRTYDTNGVLMTTTNWNSSNHLAFPIGNQNTAYFVPMPNAYGDIVGNDQINSYYLSNAVPASVELEVAFLEQRILARYKGIGSANPGAQREYLSNHVSEVHLFRQRIPIRNIDYTAYK